MKNLAVQEFTTVWRFVGPYHTSRELAEDYVQKLTDRGRNLPTRIVTVHTIDK